MLLGCRALVVPEETVSERDEECLGSKTTIKWLRLRDQLYRRGLISSYRQPGTEVDNAIRNTFEAELREAEYFDN
jgi:hypothetical protein